MTFFNGAYPLAALGLLGSLAACEIDPTTPEPAVPEPPTVSLFVSQDSIGESSGAFTATLALSRATDSNILVGLQFAGTAKVPDDYATSDTQVEIPAGEVAGSIAVTIVDDTEDDDGETIVVSILALYGDVVPAGPQSATITIVDDDEPIIFENRLSIPSDLEAQAGGTAVIPVRIELAELSEARRDRLGGVSVRVTYDTAVLALNSVQIGDLLAQRGWVQDIAPIPGGFSMVALPSLTSPVYVEGPAEDVFVNLFFFVSGGVPHGPMPINLTFGSMLDEQGRELPLADEITDRADDAGDGVLTIIG